MDNIRVIREVGELATAVSWLFEGDTDRQPTTLACDTETMGKQWLKATRVYEAGKLQFDGKPVLKDPVVKAQYEQLKAAKKALASAELKREALEPSTSHLAVVQLANSNDRCLVISLERAAMTERVRLLFNELLQEGHLWLFHNAAFDFTVLHYHLGLDWCGQRLHDTMIAESLILAGRPGKLSLKEVSQRYPQVPEKYRKIETASAVSDWWGGMTEQQIKYASIDVLSLHHVFKAQDEVITQNKLRRVRLLEMQLCPILRRVERVGVELDKSGLQGFVEAAQAKRAELEAQVKRVYGDVNVRSTVSMVKAFESVWGKVPFARRINSASGAFEYVKSVDRNELLRDGFLTGEDERTQATRAFVELKTLLGRITMANKWLAMGGRFHPGFKQVSTGEGGTVTGRLASSPNLQNIPDFMKQFLVAPEGYVLLSSDYSGIELRVMASIANEQVMIEAFREGRDLHSEMAAAAFSLPSVERKSKERRVGKECNFGFLYGMGGPSFCYRVLKATDGKLRLTEDEGWKFRETFFKRYPAIYRYHQSQAASAFINGYVTTRLGRRRYYNPNTRPQVDPSKKRTSFYSPQHGTWINEQVHPQAVWRSNDWKWKNAAYNMPIQGTSADAMKQALINADTRLRSDGLGAVFASVHDSMDCLVRLDALSDAQAVVDDCMVSAMVALVPDVPIVVEHTAGRSWSNGPSVAEGALSLPELWQGPVFNTHDELVSWMDSQYQREIRETHACL